MTIRGIDHINIATTKLKETRDFYVDVLGLTEGERPPFDFEGHWLYAEGFPIVHMQLSPREVTSSTSSGLNHASRRRGCATPRSSFPAPRSARPS